MKKFVCIAVVIFCEMLCMQTVNGQTSSRLIPKKGLYVTTNELNWISGSEINFLTADRKNHHYYFTWWEQDTDSSVKGKDILQIGSDNTAVSGFYSLHNNQAQSNVQIDCKWNIAEAGVADIIHAKIWMPFLKESSLIVNHQTIAWDSISNFVGKELDLQTPFGNFHISSSSPFKIKRSDAPNPGKNDYDKRSQYLLLYEQNILVDQQHPLVRMFSIEQTKVMQSTSNIANRLQLMAKPVSSIWEPDLPISQVLPKPKMLQLSDKFFSFPVSEGRQLNAVEKDFLQMLRNHWQLKLPYKPSIIAIKDSMLGNEAYKINTTNKSIFINYNSASGLSYALQTLVQLVQNQQGILKVPIGKVEDEPAIAWRGIHMFVGPTALPFHQQMFSKVLLPLKINKTVLQCEQSIWKSFPEMHNSIAMPLNELQKEFQFLRKHHVEPIPLIQSLGHMEWFFKTVQHRYMAVNPKYPYTLNPTIPDAQKAVVKIWKEAFDLLNPTVMHVGFDEIGMIGFNEPKENEVIYWKMQIKLLDSIAKSRKAKLMLWGDMGLAADEGPDACNGVTKERAAILRSTIPAGSYVADWHYINNANPEIYKNSLRIWKQNNNQPLASPWLYANNVRGFTLAAVDEKAGLLQTTWADFESSEKNMLLNIEQFGAYILALDYAWSGRKELPEQLPYSPIEKWNQLYFEQAKPLTYKNGWQLIGTSNQAEIDFKDITSVNCQQKAAVYNLPLQKSFNVSGWKCNAYTANILQEGMPLAKVQFWYKNKIVKENMLRYGVDVRAIQDKRPIFKCIAGKDTRSLYDFSQQDFMVDEMKIIQLHSAAGLQIQGFWLIE